MVQNPASAGPADHSLGGNKIARQWLIALLLFAAALCFYTRHNTFPFYYHPDEPSKVAQIRDGSRNFHHPLLLLTVTQLTKQGRGGKVDCQGIVEIGRWWSAIFAATAVAAFSWLGFNRFGLRGGILAGVLMVLQRRPYELAHFMKEDCALLAGIALTFVAIDAFWRRPALLRAVSLGAASALAASGKYIGFIVLVPAIAAVSSRRKSLPLFARLGACLGAFLLAMLLINFPALIHPSALVDGIREEVTHLNSRFGVETQHSPFGWVRYFLETSPVLLLFMLGYVAFVLARFRRVELPDLLQVGFPFLFGLLLCFSSKQGGRYMLPVNEVAALLGTFGALRFWEEARRENWRWVSHLIVLLLACSFGYDLVRTGLMVRAFGRDHRRELVEWMKENVASNATVAIEERVGIPAELPGRRQRFCELPPPIPQKLLAATFASDLGSLEELRAKGVTHVAVTEGRYYLFVEEGRWAAPGAEEIFQRRRTFYRRLFREGKLVWSRKTGKVGVLNPTLRLYDISALPPIASP